MAIIKLPDGRWRVDIEPVKGKRFRKTLKTKGEALRFEAHCRANFQQLVDHQETMRDKRSLLELVQLWHDLHGVNLRDVKKTFSRLCIITEALGNPVAQTLAPGAFIKYRNARLSSGIKPKTLNTELGFLRSVYNELYALEQISYLNPLRLVKPLKLQELELSFLTHNQIEVLLHAALNKTLNPHVYAIVLICLNTGSRWSEAENLKPSSVKGGLVTFAGTKSGRVRSVPITDDLTRFLKSHWAKYGEFTPSLSSFNRVLERSGLVLPAGQASHVLRHSFASHFIHKGGNILTLQKILGHTSLAMTMRYSHLAPDHLQDALRFNPFSDIDTFSTLKLQAKKNP